MSDEAFKLETNHSWSSEFFWPQTTTTSDDICVCCGNLRVQGHKLDCRLAKVADHHDRMASMLRRLEEHFRSNYHCCYRGKKHLGGHDTDCILEETATLLRELP